MEKIQFEDSQGQTNQSNYQSPTEKGMVGWLIKKGWAKDAKTANIILIVVAIIFFSASFLVANRDLFDSAPIVSPSWETGGDNTMP